MKFVQNLAMLTAVLLASTGAYARGTVPIVDFENVRIVTATGKPLTAEEVSKAVAFAAEKMGWTVDVASPDKLRATLNLNGHTVTVDIGYTPASYSIRYADSTRMSYEPGATGAKINPYYNTWVKQLKDAVDTALRSTDKPAAAADAKPVRMGVAMTAVPKASSQVPGADCVLCIAAAEQTVSALTEHLGTLPNDDLLRVKAEAAELLKKKGFDVVVVAEDLDLQALPHFSSKGRKVARKDFSLLRQKYGVDKLLVIEILHLGVIRNFSAYFPRGDPKAVLNGESYIVNLSDNVYDVRRPINITKAAEGNWDEPPKFPGMTNAYFQTLEMARDQLLTPFED